MASRGPRRIPPILYPAMVLQYGIGGAFLPFITLYFLDRGVEYLDLRWIFFGIALAGIIRAGVSPEIFGKFFGPTMAGLGLTLLATSVIEVCSEGSSPIAADLLTRAKAPGNAVTFLLAGAATDYTEILALRETTRSWKATLALPLITVPQVLVISWLLNGGM